ncbi:EAL domain-containing protein [Vibrio sp. SCSIO 43136]|uniref:EAL domain-containing protein n=1 Tax=Vibrio sp. SCSIO 43136 TaxID=2819101 RepID=UPI0020751268|nr:EAL domain-containing protein [Vibrio sp. SCSIO 43136]USD67248.1 EAL domain-containing protein [Vibrio sp. SCSIO 43136]
MNIAKKVPLLVFLTGLLLATILVVTVLKEINDQSTVIVDNWLPSVQLTEQINTLTADLRNAEANHIMSIKQERIQRQFRVIKKHRSDVASKLALYEKLLSSELEKSLFRQFIQHYTNYLSEQETLLALSAQLKKKAATEIYLGLSLQHYTAYSSVLNQLSVLNRKSAVAASDHGDRLYSTAKYVETGIISFVALMVAIFALFEVKKRLEHAYSLERRVRLAIKHNTFHCVYQPIVDLSSGDIVGLEVLSRLSDKSGDIFPDQFIPLILDSGNSWLFTQQMVGKALEELSNIDNIPSHFKVTFNIFPSDISSGDISELIDIKGMQEFPGKVVLEVIENESFSYEAAQQQIKKLKRQGFMIAIDDFGTGYANLSQLEALAADYLKIDKSFVYDVDVNSIKSLLIPHIVKIAKEIDMRVIAEGVESRSQHLALFEMGVEQGQGWTFGKPVPLNELSHCFN